MLCLEHYELPASLMDAYDGWSSRKVVDLYTRYAEIAFERYGDRVKQWFTFNEPIVIQTRCYLDAIRWPHEQNTKMDALELSQSIGVRPSGGCLS